MIIVHIPADDQSKHYAQYCFESMMRMASPTVGLRLIIHRCEKHNAITPVQSHCKALLEAFQSTADDPQALHIICDSDTVVIRPNWDIVIRRELETYDCVGTAYQRIGTKQTGNGRMQTYKDKPNVEWLALGPWGPWHLFEPAITGKPDPVMSTTPEEQDLWGLPKGYQLLTDACWNLPLFFRDYGLKSLAMENVDPVVALKGLRGYEEWHLRGEPFVVHQGKSRKNPFRSDGYSAVFYDRCDQLLNLPPTNGVR
jgi:hypothetical protein